ncbi:MAG: biotin synthase BioB [Isosphaeraceae bacterium]
MPASPTAEATDRQGLTRDDVASVYHTPLLELIFRAAEVHRRHHDPSQVQVCVLLSVKTGGCSEDCGYCPQSAHFKTQVTPEGLMDVDAVVSAAERARAEGATRFCMGAAWREVHEGRGFDRVLEMVRSVKSLGLETCCTLGMLTPDQARRLKEAGLDAYNHNLDTSPEYYSKVITTRTYDERLETLGHVRDAGISVCCGGIVGMGETDDDRIGLLHTLASLPQHPESVPVNALVAVSGTPLEGRPKVDVFSMVRMIATARILMPRSMVRLSAGRVDMTEAEQALCFLAGANSIFAGEKLLTTPNPGEDRDRLLFEHLNLTPRPSVHAEV